MYFYNYNQQTPQFGHSRTEIIVFNIPENYLCDSEQQLSIVQRYGYSGYLAGFYNILNRKKTRKFVLLKLIKNKYAALKKYILHVKLYTIQLVLHVAYIS